MTSEAPGNEELDDSLTEQVRSVDWPKVLLSQQKGVVGLDDQGRAVRYHRDGTISQQD